MRRMKYAVTQNSRRHRNRPWPSFPCVLICFIIIMKRLRSILNRGICWWSKWAGEQSGWTSAIHIQLTTSYVCHNCHSYKSYYKTDTCSVFSTAASLSLLLVVTLAPFSLYSTCVPVSSSFSCFGPAFGYCFGPALSSSLLTNALFKIY